MTRAIFRESRTVIERQKKDSHLAIRPRFGRTTSLPPISAVTAFEFTVGDDGQRCVPHL